MLTIKTMPWHKQGALWMLLAVLLWIAAPAFPCLAAAARHDCCRAMMQDCAPMSIQGSCCELRPAKTIVTPVSAYAPKRGPQLSALPITFLQQPLRASAMELQNLRHAPPPDPSPGGISVLRI